MSINKPAILGGTPAITGNHSENCKWPLFDNKETEAIQKVLADGDISTHPVRHELEEAYASRFNRKHALSHNNGTSGLFAAFFACGLKAGDEVLVTSATWWASVVPMLWLGALPVFCECETEKFGICVSDMKKKVTSKTKAIVVVHLWGMPSKMDEIEAFAKEHNLLIIEDASHAHGASINDRPCGSFGDVSVFSLQGDKLAPAGEGGVLLTDNYDIYEKALCFGDVMRIYQLETPAKRFAATSFGVKTRIAPISAAIGLCQLKKLNQHNQRRNKNIETLSKELELLGFNTFLGDDTYKRTYFEFIIKWTNKVGIDIDTLVKSLSAEGAQVSASRYPLVHEQPLFSEGHWNSIARIENGLSDYDYSSVSLPQTKNESELMIRLPNFATANEEFVSQYVSAFKKVIKHSEEINSNA